MAVGPGLGAAVAAGSGGESPLRVSPTREADDDLPQIAPAEPIPTYAEPPDLASASLAGGVAEAEEPPLPDELRNLAAAAAQAPSEPVDASPGAVLNVRFARDAGSERVVTAMQAFKAVLRERPGATRVVVHVPAPGGSALPMELRGVAYDAELLAEMRRRVGDGRDRAQPGLTRRSPSRAQPRQPRRTARIPSPDPRCALRIAVLDRLTRPAGIERRPPERTATAGMREGRTER